MSKITSSFNTITNVSGRTIYVSPFTFSSDCEILYKFKNTPPNSWLIGFGSNGTTWNAKGCFFKLQGYNNNKNGINWVDTGGTIRDVGIDATIDSTTVQRIYSTNINRINWEVNNTAVAYRDTSTSVPLGVRFDVFNNNDYEIDYIKVKPKAS